VKLRAAAAARPGDDSEAGKAADGAPVGQVVEAGDERGPARGGSSGQTMGLFNWSDAKQYCQDLVLSGYDDWRLPWLQELRGLTDRKRANSVISPSAFPNTPIGTAYWTAKQYLYVAWFVSFSYGDVGRYDVSTSLRVRCVR